MPSRSVHFRLQILAAIMSTVTAVSAASARLDFARLVDIGDGRRIFLECRGAGSPTVILISGKGNGAADWNENLDPADPAHSATTDAVGAGQGDVHASQSAVLPMVSRFTRVCAYDRPGTRIEGPDVSTPIPQPHSIGVALDDLHALLAASGEPRPTFLSPTRMADSSPRCMRAPIPETLPVSSWLTPPPSLRSRWRALRHWRHGTRATGPGLAPSQNRSILRTHLKRSNQTRACPAEAPCRGAERGQALAILGCQRRDG